MAIKNPLVALFFLSSLLLGSFVNAAGEESEGLTTTIHMPTSGDKHRESVCTKVSDGASKGWKFLCNKMQGLAFIGLKTAADAATLYWAIDQINATDEFRDSLVTLTCPPNSVMCLNNGLHLIRDGRNCYYSEIIITGGFTALALIADAAAFVAYLFSEKDVLMDSSAGMITGVSFLINGVSFIGTLSINGTLWYGAMNYIDGIPGEVIDKLNAAIKRGIPVMVLNTITGLPGACIICYFAAQSK